METPATRYNPTELTDAELALLARANRHEHAQTSGDITAALGTVALAFTGGLVETTPPAIERQEQGDEELIIDSTQRELGAIAATLTLDRRYTEDNYHPVAQQTYIPSTEALADAAFLLAAKSDTAAAIDYALKQAERQPPYAAQSAYTLAA